MSNLRQRIDRMERQIGTACPTCAAMREQAIFLDEDGDTLPGSRPASCPKCGREFTDPPKVYVGIDPALI